VFDCLHGVDGSVTEGQGNLHEADVHEEEWKKKKKTTSNNVLDVREDDDNDERNEWKRVYSAE